MLKSRARQHKQEDLSKTSTENKERGFTKALVGLLEWMGGWMSEQSGRVDGQVDGWVGEWTDGWIGWMTSGKVDG